jgi:hypothetical protein
MKSFRSIVLGTLAYAGVTFPLAYLWHLVVFADLYTRLRFVTVPVPNVPLGFLTILSQGVLLAFAYPHFNTAAGGLRRGLTFGLLMGAFLGSATAVAYVAKHDAGGRPGAFIGMEGAYFLINFVVYGVVMSRIHRGEGDQAVA